MKLVGKIMCGSILSSSTQRMKLVIPVFYSEMNNKQAVALLGQFCFDSKQECYAVLHKVYINR
jgi:hypothetical protein